MRALSGQHLLNLWHLQLGHCSSQQLEDQTAVLLLDLKHRRLGTKVDHSMDQLVFLEYLTIVGQKVLNSEGHQAVRDQEKSLRLAQPLNDFLNQSGDRFLLLDEVRLFILWLQSCHVHIVATKDQVVGQFHILDGFFLDSILAGAADYGYGAIQCPFERVLHLHLDDVVGHFSVNEPGSLFLIHFSDCDHLSVLLALGLFADLRRLSLIE